MAVRKTAARAKARPAHPAGWNEERRGIFLATLAACSNVAAAERKAGMAPGNAYRERRKTPAFGDAWADALDDGYSQLELLLLRRALEGVTKRTTKRGDVTVVEDLSDRLGMALLAAHRASVTARRAGGGAVDAETARERLARKLEEMKRRLGDDGTGA